MSSQSFYRKWRSQTFSDVVGQSHVTQTLRNALQMGRVAHAYLFCGPRGVGKTSIARILAKAVNCEHPLEGEPCNQCPMCKAITEGRALDVVEVDAASNRRIEEMRDLRDKVKFAPSEARYKVYILDEAHMLTGEASNALLKTLEEPPPRTVFMLVTTEAHKIADTIVSRCQRFTFRRISPSETVKQLTMVCEREGLTVAPEALALVARVATGSLRDAEGLLDQLVAYCGNEMTLVEVQSVLGLSPEETVRRLAACVVDGQLAEGLDLINEVADSGADLRQFGEDVMNYLRGVLLIKSGAGTTTLRDVSADALESMRACASRTTLEHLLTAIRCLSEIDQGPRGLGTPQLAVELALTEAILHREREQRQPARENPAEVPLRRPPTMGRPESKTAASPARLTGGPTATSMPAKESQEQPKAASSLPDRPNEPPAEVPKARTDIARQGPVEILTLDTFRGLWSDVLDSVGNQNKALQALLRSCGPYQVRDGALVIGCESQFHREKVGETQHRRLLETALGELLGAVPRVVLEVVPRQKRGQPLPVTSDPLVKEVLSWGGRIKAVVSERGEGETAAVAEDGTASDEEV